MQTLDTIHTDVAIVGAGPSGAWAAYCLAACTWGRHGAALTVGTKTMNATIGMRTLRSH